jgi:hypothetical protein
MRTASIAFVLFMGIGLMSCNSGNNDRREGPAARQAGRDAYRASREAKRDAKEAERELRNAGKEFREGWNDAHHDDADRRQK